MAKIWKTFQKDPDGVVDFTVNWAHVDGTNTGLSSDRGWLQGDTIATSTWFLPLGITKDSDTNDTTACTIWLSGGTDGENYDITNRITTAAGRTQDRTIRIECREQ